MPPQAGVFALPYKASKGADIHNVVPDIAMSYNPTRSPILQVEDGAKTSSKDKKRRDIAGKLGKDPSDQRRDESLSRYADQLASHQQAAHQLAVAPHAHPAYILSLYPLSLERAAQLHQLSLSEAYALECAQVAWEEEHAKVEEEWRKGRERIRDRMLEGIEDRRKRAREDKDGEGTVAGEYSSMDPQSRPHATRKLRNKMGQSHVARSPSPLSAPNPAAASAAQTSTDLANVYSLALDTLPSPFPLPLPLKEPPPRRGGKQSAPAQQAQSNGLGNARATNGDGGLIPSVGTGAALGLGKSIAGLTNARDIDIEADLMELRRGARRKRQAVANLARG